MVLDAAIPLAKECTACSGQGRDGALLRSDRSFTFCRNVACVSVSGKSVKQRSLFLHNLPPSMDENFLKILFPRSLKVGLVKVSDDIR